MSTESDVFDLLDQIAARGGRIPSIRDIRQRLGKGSMTTINKAVQAWKVKHQLSTEGLSAIPEELSDVLSQSITEGIWKAVRPLLLQKLSEQKKDFQYQLDSLQKDFQGTQDALSESEERCGQLEAEVAKLRQELKEAQLAAARAEGALAAYKDSAR